MNYYPNKNDELIQTNHQMYNHIRGLYDNLQFEQSVNQQLRARISALNRKPKPKQVTSEVICDSDGLIKCQTIYSDGSVKSEVMIMSYYGRFFLCPIHSVDLPLGDDYYLLTIGRDVDSLPYVAITVSRENMTKGSCLMRLMEAAGVIFSKAIPSKTIAEALARTLTGLEIRAKSLQISLLTGWHNRIFFDRSKWESDFCLNNLRVPFSPVKDKHFCREEPTQEMMEVYLDFFAGFPSWKARLTLMMYIFVGVFSSLFHKHHIAVPFYLNLLAEDVRNQDVAALFQVFNRHQLGVVNAGLTTRMLERQMIGQKDEVFILDGCCSVSVTSYESKKKRATLDALSAGVERGITLSDGRPWMNALVTISENYHYGNTINIELNRKHLAALNPQTVNAITRVLAGVVRYTEAHYDDIQMLFVRKRDEPDARSVPLSIVLDILNAYFGEWGYSLMKRLRLKEHTNFTALFSEEYDQSDEYIETLIAMVRDMTIGGKKCRSGPRVPYQVDVVYYDNLFVDVPVEMLNQYLKKRHHVEYGKRALRALRERGDLEADSLNTLVKKAQHGGIRRNYYRMRVGLFDKTGDVSFLARMEEI